MVAWYGTHGLELHCSVFALTILSLQTAKQWCRLQRMWGSILKYTVSHDSTCQRSSKMPLGISSSENFSQSVSKCCMGEKALLWLIISNFFKPTFLWQTFSGPLVWCYSLGLLQPTGPFSSLSEHRTLCFLKYPKGLRLWNTLSDKHCWAALQSSPWMGVQRRGKKSSLRTSVHTSRCLFNRYIPTWVKQHIFKAVSQITVLGRDWKYPKRPSIGTDYIII